MKWMHKNAALEAGAKVIDTNSQESGEARRARQDDQQASLHSIVTCAAAAIEQAIKYAAQWLKLDPSKYSLRLILNLLFSNTISILLSNYMKAP